MTDLELPPLAREIEFRTVTDLDVRYADRIIELIAVPYDVDAHVEVRGRMCVESVARGSFDGVERRANRVKVNRDHDVHRTIGRAVALHPSRTEGLVAELRIAETILGDETLALAADESLEASVGFAAMSSGEQWLDNRRRRLITRAYLDHISMVPEGAYPGRVLAVRSAMSGNLEPAEPIPTPNIDEVRAWMMLDSGGAAVRTLPNE